MPGYVIHLAVGKEYIKHNTDISNINEFLKGIITPDILPKPQSHYSQDTAKPDISAYIDSHPMDNDFNKGYFLHLITDYLFHTKYLKDFEWSSEIYDDYNRLNKFLIEKYDIEIPDEIQAIVKYRDDELKFLELNSICDFIETVGMINIDELIQNRKYDSVYDKFKKDDYEK